MKKILWLLTMSLLLWSSYAIDFRGDDVVTIDQPVDETLFVWWTEVTVSSTIDGDLFVGGQHVIVEWNVSEDAWIWWNNIIVNGDIQDDLRVWWNIISVSWKIAGDIMWWWNSVSVKNSVGWDAMLGWNSVRVTWPISGDATIWSEKFFVWAKIWWDVEFEGEKLEFGSWGRISGDLFIPVHSKVDDISISWYVDGDVVRTDEIFWWLYKDVSREKEWEKHKKRRWHHMKFNLFRFFSLAILWSLLMRLMPNYIMKASETIKNKPWKTLWYGALILVATPFVALILMMTWVWASVGWWLMANYLFLWIFLSLFAVVFFADMIVRKWFSAVHAHPLLVRILVIIVLSALVTVLPYVVSLILGLFWLWSGLINDMKIIDEHR